MAEHVLTREQRFEAGLEETFAFFADARNLETITPPWLRFRIVTAPDEIERGALLRYRLRLFGVPIRWLTEITRWEPPHGFTDEQRRGPFSIWVHDHDLRETDGGTLVRDTVRYRAPGGPLGEAAHALVVRRWLDGIFDYRAATLPGLIRPG